MAEPAVHVATISFTTHSNHMNYGAILHGYAFQRYLDSCDCRSVVINYRPRYLEGYSLRWPILWARKLWRHPLRAAFWVVRWTVSTFANLRKLRKIETFIRSNIRCTTHLYRERDLLAGVSVDDGGASCYVCEADVIWKKRAGDDFDSGFLLDFPAASGKAKVAYAPSLSSARLSAEAERRLVDALKDFRAISSRERQGAEYLTEILGREIDWVLDPTLLLSADDYARLARRPEQRGYVLLYTCMKFNLNMIREARMLARRTGRKLVEVGNYGINRYLFGHQVIDDAGVEDWLGLFMNAEVIVCNSFHGICFSLIFHKPFFVFSRGGGDFRFQNICEALALENRLLPADGKIPELASAIDYAAVESRLEPLRERSKAFLNDYVISIGR